jgi:agmatinase
VRPALVHGCCAPPPPRPRDDAPRAARGGVDRGRALAVHDAILDASYQVDLFDLEVDRPYEAGLHMLPLSKKILAWNKKGKAEAMRL